jgi:hypothetical protein
MQDLHGIWRFWLEAVILSAVVAFRRQEFTLFLILVNKAVARYLLGV